MTSIYVWFGVIAAVFAAGLGMGYVAFQQGTHANYMLNQQQMQYMMNDPQLMNQWHQQVMQNPQAMSSWNQYMNQNPQAMDQWMDTMMDNPQFMHSLVNNQQFQQSWMAPWLSNSTNWNHMTNSGWMNPNMNYGTMGPGMMGGYMMGAPITQQNDVVATINNIEKILDQVSTNYRNGDSNTASSLAATAYLENYEDIEGILGQKNGQLMEKIEIMLRIDLLSMIKNGDSADNIDAKIDSVKQELGNAKSLFQ